MSKPTARVSTQSLKAMGVLPEQAQMFKEPLRAACALFQIDTPARVACFLAHAVHESAKFKHLQENLFYTTPERILAVFPSRVKTLEEAEALARNPKALAIQVYSCRLGNGDVTCDDGWNFRGRGLFQLTGRDNYEAAAKALNRPYVEQPELVGEASDAALTAAWFWHSRGCNELADQRLFSNITAKINGPAMLGHDARMALYTQAVNCLD